jgi:mRNA interferase MazF
MPGMWCGSNSIPRPATNKRAWSSVPQHNGKTGLMICCPLTTRIKGYPFEILLASQSGSAVLSDQVENLDWRARRATRKGKVTDLELRLVRGKLRALIG